MVANRPGRISRLALLGCLIGFGLIGPAARAADRPAEKILGEIYAVEVPDGPGEKSGRAAKEATAKRQAALDRRSKLIADLAQQHPANPELATLLPERWSTLMVTPKTIPEAQAEVTRVLAESKDEKLLTEASAFRVRLAVRKGGSDPKVKELTPLVDDFIRRAPGDERGGEMLTLLARATKDKAKKAALIERIEKEYPDAASNRRPPTDSASEATAAGTSPPIGKAFQIRFDDAMSGRPINSVNLKGKVIVVDFWATWCGPCVEEMPKMKQLYAEFRKQGVEFIGVSLDNSPEEGGDAKLAAFVTNNNIPWPQYYQGNGWKSEFSKACGIKSIPAVFVIDAAGNLASKDARGKLETLIPELLKAAREKTKAAAKS